jgi:hypothetical protein
MVVKELVNKSIYGTIGYISSEEDLNKLEQYIIYNLPILKEFKQIIVATNYSDIDLWQNANKQLWTKYFSGCILIDSYRNRGHNHGYTDLDNMLFDYCKENNIEWLCKSANDTLLHENFLDNEIEEADFYYTTSVGYGALFPPLEVNVDKVYLTKEYFYPQNNFYFINVNKTDYINNKEYLDETYEYIKTIENYNGRIWEYIPDWSCEIFLKQCVERNKLTVSNLVSQEKFSILLEIIKNYQIHDPSHKNLMIEGICHLHNFEQQILQI